MYFNRVNDRDCDRENDRCYFEILKKIILFYYIYDVINFALTHFYIHHLNFNEYILSKSIE